MIRKMINVHKEQQGAVAVEFALLLPILAVLLFGAVEFGAILYDKAVVTNASREGARFGAVYREPGEEITCGDINTVVQNYTTGHLITFGGGGPADPTYPLGCDPGSGNELTVRVSYDYDYLVLPNLVTSLIGPITLVGETTMIKE
ncbi:MAG: pilus assembly protein [Nitrospiraceae bacterium]|nr:MAG: pilus assembly protein [Nitrospiraceae bacterium]